MKESIIIYARQKTALKRLTDAQKGVLLDALLTYAGGEEPTFTDGMVMVAFDFFRSQIDIDGAKYEEVSIKRREAGRQGGLAKKANVTKSKQNVANATKSKQNVHDNDNDNVNDNDNDNDNVNESIEVSEKPKRTRKTIPPTLEEIKEYCASNGLIINPDIFFNHYEMTGWRLNNNVKMKDWQAACRKWNITEKERQTTKFNNNGNGNHNSDHPTNAEVIRNTEELIREFTALDEQGVPFFRDF